MRTHRLPLKTLAHGLFGASMLGMALWVGSFRLVAQEPSPPKKTTEGPQQMVLGKTCSVSASGAILAGRPKDYRAAATNRWPKRDLNIHFLDGKDAWNQSVRQKVREIVKEWERYADIRFTFNPSVIADIIITLEPTPQFPSGVYQSMYGPEALDETREKRPSMWLIFAPDTPDSEIKRVVLHEFGHALGLIHEQKRPDAPIEWHEQEVFDYYAYTGWDNEQIREQVMKPFTGPLVDASPFDPTSIMIYPIPAGLANVVVDWTRELSPMDKLFISLLYPFDEPSTAFRAIMVDGPPVRGVVDRAGKLVRYRFTVPQNGRYVVEASGPSPVLIGVFGSSVIQTQQQRAAATEGVNARIVADLKADLSNKSGLPPGTYFVFVRHQEPRTGTGSFSVAVRKQ